MRASALRASLVLSLLLFSTLYAAAPGLCPPTTFVGYLIAGSSVIVLAAAIGISVIALLASMMLIAVVYIITKLIPGIHIGRWLQNEYKEFIKSALIVATIFSVLSILSGIAVALMGSPGTNYLTNVAQLTYQSEVYLCGVNDQLINSMNNMFELSLAYGALSKSEVEWPGIPLPPEISYAIPVVGEFLMNAPVFYSGFGARPFGNDVLGLGGSQYSSMFNDMVTFVEFPVMTFYSSQIYLVPLFESVGLLMLIPLGLIFRAVPLVRGIGGTLLGLGIGLAIIWPSMLVLVNAPISSYFSSVFSTQIVQPTVSHACDSWGILSTICNSILQPTGGFLLGLLKGIGISASTLVSIYPTLNYLMEYNLYLIFQFYFLFILDLILAYSITDNIARLLGGSIRLSLGRRLKLI